MAELIKQATLLMVSSETIGAGDVGDVLIEAGQIKAIAPEITDIPSATEVIEAQGQFVGPGLVDLYSQSGEPGHEPRETRDSLRQAALAGGFTRVGLLPNAEIVTDGVEAIAAIEQGNAPGGTQLLPWAAITLAARGEQLSELAELATSGAIGFTDGLPIANNALLRRLLEYAGPLQKPIMLWPCDRQLAGGGVAREGPDSLRLGFVGVSSIAETTALATIIEYIAEIPLQVHIMRVSTARSVELIRQAKTQNFPITASVPWHHLIYDTKDLETYHPSLRHDPPLGTPDDKQALTKGVGSGVIDAIAIDHSPYTYEEKTVSFGTAPPGAIGLELALPVLWHRFVASGAWSPDLLWQRLSQDPLRCLGLSAARFEVGQPAELTLFDPKETWQVTHNHLRSLSTNTPLEYQTIQGRVTKTWNS